jgi:Aspartyl protease
VNRCGSGLAEAQLPAGGWTYEYAAIEAPRRGRDVFRPVVPVRLAHDQPSTIAALVDSGSEHTLAAHWLADDLGIDLSTSQDRLRLGIGGRSVEATFVQVDLLLYRDHGSDEHVTWRTDVGFLEPWDAEFYLILGQIGFYDQFTITMNRRLLTVKVSDVETI